MTEKLKLENITPELIDNLGEKEYILENEDGSRAVLVSFERYERDMKKFLETKIEKQTPQYKTFWTGSVTAPPKSFEGYVKNNVVFNKQGGFRGYLGTWVFDTEEEAINYAIKSYRDDLNEVIFKTNKNKEYFEQSTRWAHEKIEYLKVLIERLEFKLQEINKK